MMETDDLDSYAGGSEVGDGDHGISDSTASLTGFLFGNIDEKGELEGDFLDEVCK